MEAREYDLMMKMVFVGDSGVGKTNLLTRLTKDRFNEQYLATIGVEFQYKNFYVDGLKIRVQMWDTAGQERYKSMSAPYYRGAGSIVLCYDMNNASSVENLEKWFDQVMRYAGENTQTTLIGCKSDLQNKVPADIINQMIGQRGFKHYTTSAKTSKGVEEAFESIVKDWTRKMVRESLQIASEKKQKEANQRMAINKDSQANSSGAKKSCC